MGFFTPCQSVLFGTAGGCFRFSLQNTLSILAAMKTKNLWTVCAEVLDAHASALDTMSTQVGESNTVGANQSVKDRKHMLFTVPLKLL